MAARWRKLGRIFDPAQHRLPMGCTAYAQSPQALVFNDFVRIYFSTRAIDPVNGKYLSQVAFVDVDRALRKVLQVSDRPIIPLGGLGCFDEHGIFPFNVLRHGDAILAYTCGWNRRVSVSVDTAIGLAISRDGGMSFDRVGTGPVVGPSLHEPFLVGDAFVKVIDSQFHMWYIFGTSWRRDQANAAPDRTYKIGHAISADGTNWTKEEARQIIPDTLGPEESQALPSVTQWGGKHHMVFCYRQSFDFRANRRRGYRIGHASSNDLLNWERDDATPAFPESAGEWDSDMQCYPHLLDLDGQVYMLYNGNEFGRHGFGVAILEQ